MDFTESEVVDDSELEDCEGELPLAHRAAATGDIDILTRAIRADPTILEHQDAEGLTPLAHATMAQESESVKLLVKMGASINAQDSLGRTCLIMAAYQGWLEGVIFLLRNGSKQSIGDKSGRTPLHSSTYDVDTRVLATLLQTLSIDEINQQDNEGMTPLHWATFHNRPNHVDLLLAKGADLFIQDIDGKTALHWAAQIGSAVCCGLLCTAPDGIALVNLPDFSGKNAVHFAAAAGHCEVIRELSTTRGCDLEAEDPDERTPLHWSAATGQAEAISTLLELNASPNPVDIEGATPMDYAQKSDHSECVSILEQRLGLRHEGTDASLSSRGLADANQATRSPRRNPLGFIADFFRSRRPGSRGEPPGNELFSPDLSVSSQSSMEDINDNNNTVVNASGGMTLAGLAATSNNNMSDSEDNSEDLISDIRSITKLQLSRQDHPSLLRHGYEFMEMEAVGEQPQVHHKVLPPLVLDKAPPVHHDLMIRSPPPMLKRPAKLSPTLSRGSTMNREGSRTRVEDDVADILALQGGAGAVVDVAGYPQLSPVGRTRAVHTKQPVAKSMSDHSAVRSSTLRPRDAEPLGRTLSATTQGQLAPLRGQVPRLSTSPVIKQLEELRLERSGTNRSPTPPLPPGWGRSPISSEHSASTESSPQVDKKKQKKKKQRKAGRRHPKLLPQRTERPDSPGSDGSGHAGSRDSQSSSAKPLSAYQQRLAMDRSIAHLLH